MAALPISTETPSEDQGRSTSDEAKVAVDEIQSDSDSDISEEAAQDWISQAKPLRILIIGQVGSGKSALVNSLVGGSIDQAIESDSPTAATQEVQQHVLNINGVEVTIFDSPGLLQPGKDDSKIFKEMATVTQTNVDLILYCKKMTSRLDQSDTKLMRGLTDAFGESVWKNTLIVLTYANEIRLPRSRRAQAQATSTESLEDHFTKLFQEIVEMFHKLLKTNANVPANIVEAIPVVPAGYDSPSLPGYDEWFTNLWEKAFSVTKPSAQSAFFKINLNRFSNDPTVSHPRIITPSKTRKEHVKWALAHLFMLTGVRKALKEWIKKRKKYKVH